MSKQEMHEALVNALAREIVAAQGAKIATSDMGWVANVRHYDWKCRENPAYANEKDQICDAFRAARAFMAKLEAAGLGIGRIQAAPLQETEVDPASTSARRETQVSVDDDSPAPGM